MAAPRDAADARSRGARDDALSPGQGPWLVLRRLRPGGRVGRRRVRDGPRGQAVHSPPRPRRAPDPRRHPGPDPGSVPRPRHRHHPRARRQRALRRPDARLRRDGLDAARHDARRDRDGDGVQAARRATLRDDLVRRRLDLARRLPRGDELGRRAEVAGHVRAREQPVRVLDAARQAVRRRPRGTRRGVRIRRSHGRRQRRRSDVRGRPRRTRAGAGRRRADADRGRDDADARPRRPRRHEVRAQGAGRRVAPARPDRPPGRAAARARRRRGRAARRGHRRDRRRDRRGARRADARPRAGRTACSAKATPSRSATACRAGAGSGREEAR